MGKTKKEASGAAAAAAPPNRAYSNRDKTLPIECIYLYYMTESADPRQYVRAYLFDRGRPIAWNAVEAEVQTILSEITGKNISPGGYALGDLKWRRKSYLVFLYDDPHGRLTPTDAVRFWDVMGGINHPFADGKDMTPFRNVTGFYCINHMAENGGPHPIPPNKHEYYRVEVQHSHPLGNTIKILGHNDSGTNMGPPISP